MVRHTQLQSAYVLHTRPYRETSLLVDFFTVEQGRIRAVARSSRGPKSRFRGVLQLFVPLQIVWSGKSDLVSLNGVELEHPPHFLSGQALISGFYLNELLVRLLHPYDPHPRLFHAYRHVLLQLVEGGAVQASLRMFEKTVLAEIGYGLRLTADISNAPIEPDAWYDFDPGHGLEKVLAHTQKQLLSGAHLLAIHNNELSDPAVLHTAKQLMRLAIAAQLGDKPIKSRELL